MILSTMRHPQVKSYASAGCAPHTHLPTLCLPSHEGITVTGIHAHLLLKAPLPTQCFALSVGVGPVLCAWNSPRRRFLKTKQSPVSRAASPWRSR